MVAKGYSLLRRDHHRAVEDLREPVVGFMRAANRLALHVHMSFAPGDLAQERSPTPSHRVCEPESHSIRPASDASVEFKLH
jgi:hypothetical protein